jgi:hypothetical protein
MEPDMFDLNGISAMNADQIEAQYNAEIQARKKGKNPAAGAGPSPKGGEAKGSPKAQEALEVGHEVDQPSRLQAQGRQGVPREDDPH